MAYYKRKRRSAEDRSKMEHEALSRAVSNQTMANWPDIFRGFMAMGIPEASILPRENVFTYHAWRALGRQVRRGEHGVKVTTWIQTSKEEKNPETGELKEKRRGYCTSATVFHVSQTDPMGQDNSYVTEANDPAQQKRLSSPDPVDMAYEDRCAEACGMSNYGPPS